MLWKTACMGSSSSPAHDHTVLAYAAQQAPLFAYSSSQTPVQKPHWHCYLQLRPLKGMALTFTQACPKIGRAHLMTVTALIFRSCSASLLSSAFFSQCAPLTLQIEFYCRCADIGKKQTESDSTESFIYSQQGTSPVSKSRKL